MGRVLPVEKFLSDAVPCSGLTRWTSEVIRKWLGRW